MKTHLAVLLLGWSVAAVAAPDDVLRVAADRVNLRDGPSLERPVLSRLSAGTDARELARHQGWVNLNLDTDPEPEGWVHQDLLVYPDSGLPAALEPFHTIFTARNRHAMQATGEVFFTGLRYLGKGRLEVAASEVWLEQPQAGRQANLEFIMNIWQQVHPEDLPLAVYIVDAEGKRRMSLTR